MTNAAGLEPVNGEALGDKENHVRLRSWGARGSDGANHPRITFIYPAGRISLSQSKRDPTVRVG